MKPKNYYLIAAGVICLFTALLHTIGGQIDLVAPLMKSNLSAQQTTEWLGVWHMVTIVLFAAAYFLLKIGLKPNFENIEVIRLFALLFLFFGLVFILASIANGILAPQWILCLPIAILSYLGVKQLKRNEA